MEAWVSDRWVAFSDDLRRRRQVFEGSGRSRRCFGVVVVIEGCETACDTAPVPVMMSLWR